MRLRTLDVPQFFDPSMADKLWSVPYQQREKDAIASRRANHIPAYDEDSVRVAMLIIDPQVTFCMPPPVGQLFVGGRSGRGAIDDSIRTAQFIYRNLPILTQIIPTRDTHVRRQIFHGIWWVDQNGDTIDATFAPFIELADVESGKIRPNQALAADLFGGDYNAMVAYSLYYIRTLTANGKYKLQLWPYHGMKGSVGNAIVPIIEEAIFFHGIARSAPDEDEVKGDIPYTENYSIFEPEVTEDENGNPFGSFNINDLFCRLMYDNDMVITCGQASSHCWASTMEHLRQKIEKLMPTAASKVYFLEDCMSPVVIPGVCDCTDMAEDAMQRMVKSGMHRVKSTDPIYEWPDSPVA